MASDPEEFVRTRPLAHWSDGNTSITGQQGPPPEDDQQGDDGGDQE